MEKLEMVPAKGTVHAVVGDGIESFEVRELSVKELTELGHTGARHARKAWLGRVKEMASLLSQDERLMFLALAARNEPDLAIETDTWLTSEDGINCTIKVASPTMFAKLAVVSENSENAEAIVKAWNIALGIPTEGVAQDPLAGAGL